MIKHYKSMQYGDGAVTLGFSCQTLVAARMIPILLLCDLMECSRQGYSSSIYIATGTGPVPASESNNQVLPAHLSGSGWGSVEGA
jgi:hypothetical protein